MDPGASAFWTKLREDQWELKDWRFYESSVRKCARALLRLGIEAGERAFYLSKTSAERAIFYLGCMSVGIVPTGYYTSSTPKEVQHVLQHSGATILVVKKKDYRKHFKSAKEAGDFPNLKHVVILGDKPYDGDMMSWDTFMRLGQANASVEGEAKERGARVSGDDTAVLIYSPGTEGYPKGVLLSHNNLIWTSNNVVTSFGFVPEDRYVSFLSLCHVCEQVLAIYAPIIVGHVVYFSPNVRELHTSLRELQPTILAGPPELWITFYASLHPVIPDGAEGLDKLVVRKLKNRIGCERVRVALIGQTSTPLKIFQFFHSLGIDLLEVYGQLETTGLTTLNRHRRMKWGTVGRPCPKCDVKVSVRGEVMVRGPNVFKGYHGNDRGTQETLKDGWLLTGDRGDLREGHLYIPGRLQDEIQTSDGLKVYPATLETQLRALDLVRYALVVGHDKEYLCTVLVVDPVIAKRAAKESGVGEATTFIASPEVQKLVSEHIERLNDEEARIPIRKFTISSKITGLKSNRGEVTPTMNMRRSVLKKVFEKEINAFYAGIAPQMGVELVETTSTILARGGKLTDGYFYLKVGDAYRRTKLQQQEVEDLQAKVIAARNEVRSTIHQLRRLQEEVGQLGDDEDDAAPNTKEAKEGKKGKEKGKKGKLLKKGK